MKYLSVDIETTGLDAETCQILSIGAVIEDTNDIKTLGQMPRFHAVIPHTKITGEPYALNLNKDLIELINKYHMAKTTAERDLLGKSNEVSFVYESNMVRALMDFLGTNGLGIGKVTVAGKNYQGFDEKFLKKLPGWNLLSFHRRVIDPAALYMNWKEDSELPDLNKCKIRAGVAGWVTHNALDDAFDVVKILRTKY